MSSGSENASNLARREQPDALAQILGGGDVLALVAIAEQNAKAIVDISRKRGFITRFEQVDRRTGQVRVSEFYGLPTWQLIAMTYGITPVVEWVKAIDGGYHARAVVRTRDGVDVGGAEALCHRKEPGKQKKSDHDIAAMAQARAMRNAIRSTLGSVLVLAGLDLGDPELPATPAQVGMLHQLERELHITHDEGHRRLGLGSYKELTREQASEIIEVWQEELAAQEKGAGRTTVTVGHAGTVEGEEEGPPTDSAVGNRGDHVGPSSPATDEPPPPAPDPDQPAVPEQFARAERMGLTKAQLLRRARQRFGEDITSVVQLTRGQMAEILEEAM